MVYSRHCSRHRALGSTQTTSKCKMPLVVRSAWKDETVCKIDRVRVDKFFQKHGLAG